MTIADIKVPTNANSEIVPKFLKNVSYDWFDYLDQNFFLRVNWEIRFIRTLCISYPEFKIIGGKRRLKKYVSLKVTILWIVEPSESLMINPMTIPIKRDNNYYLL